MAVVRTPADGAGGRALVAADRQSALVTATLEASADEGDVVARATHRLEHVPGVTLGGPAVAGEQIGDQVNSDLGRAELLAFPLLALLALFFFRGGRAAALPLMVGLLAVVCSFVVIRLIDSVYGLSVYSLNVIFGLGLGLGIDYALFLVLRFREELGAGRDVQGAVHAAMATAGRTVVFSALTVAAAMASLVVFPQQFLKSIGIGGAVVALVAAYDAPAPPARALHADGPEADAARRRPEPGRDPLGTDHGHRDAAPGGGGGGHRGSHDPRGDPDAARAVDRRRRGDPAGFALRARSRRPAGGRLPAAELRPGL